MRKQNARKFCNSPKVTAQGAVVLGIGWLMIFSTLPWGTFSRWHSDYEVSEQNAEQPTFFFLKKKCSYKNHLIKNNTLKCFLVGKEHLLYVSPTETETISMPSEFGEAFSIFLTIPVKRKV